MREIRFKAWDTFNERTIDDPYRFRPNTDTISDDPRFNAPYQYVEDWQDDDDGVWQPCHIMQFTGLHDKNGKEIWEGDIIKNGFSIGIGVVVWWKWGWFIEVNGGHFTFDTAKHQQEVVGNIHQHPELMTTLKSNT